MSFDHWLFNLSGEIEMTKYKVTIGAWGEHTFTIKCDNEINACWQAYEIARRFGKPLQNVELA